jgi:2'-5' RNA ligase
MTKERLKSPRARLFVALDLPADVRAGVDAWGQGELDDPALRPLPSASLHVTLVFLGYRPEKEVDRLAEIVEAIDAPAAAIALRDPVARPERGRPRLYALPVESAEAVRLQAGLEESLVAAGLHEPGGRPFWPHLTVARVRPESRGSKRPQRVESPPGPLPAATKRTDVRVVRASLYRSELKLQGAKYTRLAHVDLR